MQPALSYLKTLHANNKFKYVLIQTIAEVNTLYVVVRQFKEVNVT